MPTVSLCMIVRNEEDVLDRCLKSVFDLVDEIIIVDTGSTDSTKEIAYKYTDKVFDFVWVDDFSVARNFAFSKAKCEYLMWLDADDVLKDEDREQFKNLKNNFTPDINVVMMRYNTGFDENGNVTFSYYRERIIKNNVGMLWKGAVHEVIETFGRVIYSECSVSHLKLHPSDKDRNLRIFENMIKKGQVLDARQQFYYGRELYYHERYSDAIEVFENFLKDSMAWLENKIDACRHIAYCKYGLGDSDGALKSLLCSFTYDLPRAEICCDIGRHFFDREDWQKAIYWYNVALDCKRNDKNGGFISPDDYGFTPCIQICVCYSKLGDNIKAQEYNERASNFKPYSQAVIHNREYFKNINKKRL